MKRRKLARLQNLAASLNYQLVPNHENQPLMRLVSQEAASSWAIKGKLGDAILVLLL